MIDQDIVLEEMNGEFCEKDKPHHVCPPPHDFNKLTPGMLFGDISRLFDARVRHETERLGFPQGYRRIVFHLMHNDKLTQNELTKLTHMKAPSISVQLQKMETDGLIERTSDKNDLRKAYISLTEKGRECEKLFVLKCNETEKVMFNDFSEKELCELKYILTRVAKNLISDLEEKK